MNSFLVKSKTFIVQKELDFHHTLVIKLWRWRVL